MIATLMFRLFCTSIWINAAVTCPPRNALIGPSRSLVQKVALYDDLRPLNADAFSKLTGISATDLDAKYGATGAFACDNASGNGQVVIKRNVVVTVYHTLLKDRESCDSTRSLKGCVFVYKDGPKMVLLHAKKILARGDCKAGEKIGTGNDWAVIELDRSVPNKIVPYQIPSSAALVPGQAVTMVGRTSAVKPEKKTDNFAEYPQSFAKCIAVTKDTFKFFNEFQTNCPSADGSSGSAILTGEGIPTLAGVLTGDMTTKDICLPTVAPDSDDGPFEKNCRGSLVTPVEGKFLTALQRLK